MYVKNNFEWNKPSWNRWSGYYCTNEAIEHWTEVNLKLRLKGLNSFLKQLSCYFLHLCFEETFLLSHHRCAWVLYDIYKKRPHLKITWPFWGWKTTWLQKIMGVTELFMKALANNWVKLVDIVGYLLAFIQFTNKKQTFWQCISKNRFCNLHHVRLRRTYFYSCFLSGYSFTSQIYVVSKFVYSKQATKFEKISQLYRCFTNYLILKLFHLIVKEAGHWY